MCYSYSIQCVIHVSTSLCAYQCTFALWKSPDKQARCNAVSHRANGSKIADSFACERKTLQKMAGSLEPLLMNIVSSEDVLHINRLIIKVLHTDSGSVCACVRERGRVNKCMQGEKNSSFKVICSLSSFLSKPLKNIHFTLFFFFTVIEFCAHTLSSALLKDMLHFYCAVVFKFHEFIFCLMTSLLSTLSPHPSSHCLRLSPFSYVFYSVRLPSCK